MGHMRLLPMLALAATITHAGAGCADRDCKFKSGRTCENGARCEGDDGCNSCTCEDGESLCTAVGCHYEDAGSKTCKVSSPSCTPTGEPVCNMGFPQQGLKHWYCPSADMSVCPGDGCLFLGSYRTITATMWCCP